MPTIYDNLQGGTITDNPLSSGATTINSAAFANLPTVTAPDILFITLDPAAANGAPEIVRVTAHTAAATSVTVTRAQQGTSARSHPVSSKWIHGVTEVDLQEFLKTVTTANIVDANVTTAKLTDSAVTTVKIADSNVTTTKIADSNVTTAKIADSAVTTAKIADANVTTIKILDGNVTTAKIATGAVTGVKIANTSIDSQHYVNGSIDTVHIADDQITAAKLDPALPLGTKNNGGFAKTSGTDQTGIGSTPTDITGLSVTWTADSTRAYKVSMSVDISTSVAQTPTISITDGSGTVIIARNVTIDAASGQAAVHFDWVETGLSGSVTRKGRGAVAAGTLTIVNSSNRNGILIVEDIGAA